MCTASSSYPLLPAVVSLVVVVLVLIICVTLLVLALAVTATKLNKLRAEKGGTDPSHYNQTRRGEQNTKHEICSEVQEGTASADGQRGLYQELERETMEDGQYQVLNKDTTSKV